MIYVCVQGMDSNATRALTWFCLSVFTWMVAAKVLPQSTHGRLVPVLVSIHQVQSPRDSGSSWACPTYQSTSILSIPKPVNVPSLPRHVLHVQCAYLAKGYFFCWWNVLDAAALTVAWPVTLFGSVGGVRCRVHNCHHHCVWHAAMIALVLIRTIWAMLSCSLSSLSQLHQLCLSWRAGPYCGAYRLSTTVPCHSDRCHCCCCYFDTPANP